MQTEVVANLYCKATYFPILENLCASVALMPVLVTAIATCRPASSPTFTTHSPPPSPFSPRCSLPSIIRHGFPSLGRCPAAGGCRSGPSDCPVRWSAYPAPAAVRHPPFFPALRGRGRGGAVHPVRGDPRWLKDGKGVGQGMAAGWLKNCSRVKADWKWGGGRMAAPVGRKHQVRSRSQSASRRANESSPYL